MSKIIEAGSGAARHLSVEEINDLVDGLLSPAEASRARAHLEGCQRCREETAGLAEAVAALAGLPEEARVPEDVWEGVARRLTPRAETSAGPVAGGDEGILPFPGRPDDGVTGLRGGPRVGGRGFAARHLAAAAALAAVLSGGVVWLALGPGAGRDGSVTAASGPPVSVSASPARMASSGGTVAYDLAVRELEILVRDGGDLLAPETREALETSLATIDEALADVRRALEEDPSSELLMSLLVNHQTARIRVLRQAAARVQARS